MSKKSHILTIFLLLLTIMLSFSYSNIAVGPIYKAGAQLPERCSCPVLYGDCYCIDW